MYGSIPEKDMQMRSMRQIDENRSQTQDGCAAQAVIGSMAATQTARERGSDLIALDSDLDGNVFDTFRRLRQAPALSAIMLSLLYATFLIKRKYQA
jgi:hypothetical protein